MITASPESDSSFTSVRCPTRNNATQAEGASLVFQARLRAVVSQTILINGARPGSDAIRAILYGAEQTFNRFKPKYRYLVLFSDMQQSGGGVRNCVKAAASASESPACLDDYFRTADIPDESRSGALTGTTVFVAGFGQTIRGHLNDEEAKHYKYFWAAFFERQGARVCWFAPTSLPITNNPDGSQETDTRYFDEDCPPVPIA